MLNINGGSGEYIINGNGYRVIESSNIISTENTILNVSLNNITFTETLTVTGEQGANGVGDLPSKCLSRAPPAEVQPQLIQGIRREDGVGDLCIYLFIKDIKSNRMRIAQ